MNRYIDGWSVFGVTHFLTDNGDIDSYSDPVSFHHTEADANERMAEMEKETHQFDYLYVAADSQYDP